MMTTTVARVGGGGDGGGGAERGTTELRVLTFNLWGIFNARLRRERMIHFASKVAHYDIILLQEQFTAADFDLIQEHVPAHVRATRYFRRFPSSFYGCGCAVISRFPVVDEFFHTFPLQGLPEMVLHGDFFANKGVARIKVAVPVYSNNNNNNNNNDNSDDDRGGTHAGDEAVVATTTAAAAITATLHTREVLLYNTHLVAVYEKASRLTDWRNERYLPFRLSQAIDMAEFILSTSRPSDCVIIAGDFNCSQHSLEVQTLRYLLRRRGYMLGSALPPAPPTCTIPFTVLPMSNNNNNNNSSRHATAAAGGSTWSSSLLPYYTFSHRNDFNVSSSSYFKLLHLEADIPNQIDHIFYSTRHFDVVPYTDCPDTDMPYSSSNDGHNNNDDDDTWSSTTASMPARGVVVFTRNQVAAAATAAPATSTRVTTTRPRLYPLSDHYGVAVRLRLRVSDYDSDDNTHRTSPLPLAPTPHEVAVQRSAVALLERYSASLRQQSVWLKYMATLTAGLSVLNTVGLTAATLQQQHRHVLSTLQRVYEHGTRVTRVVDSAPTTASIAADAAAAAARTPPPPPPPSTTVVADTPTAARVADALTPTPTAATTTAAKAAAEETTTRADDVKAVAAAVARKTVALTKWCAREGWSVTQRAARRVAQAGQPSPVSTQPEVPPLTTHDLRALACEVTSFMPVSRVCMLMAANSTLSIIAVSAMAVAVLHRTSNANILDRQIRRVRDE